MTGKARSRPWLTCIGLLAFASSQVVAAEHQPLLGFDPAASITQRELEERFDAAIQPSNLATFLQRLSREPHPAGSPAGAQLVQDLARQFKDWGFEVAIERYEVWLPEPQVLALEMLAPTPYHATLAEPALQEGEGDGSTVPPLFNAYSADGDVTAGVVYANFGRREDFAMLQQRGIDVTGRIVIARYGRIWRGLKARFAQENGAIGLVLYSDPAGDGFVHGAVLPDGPYRPPAGGERGSVLDISRYPGDPLTPGIAATPGAERLEPEAAGSLLEIPVLPIGYGDAEPILRSLGGPVAPEDWQGALPITYQLGDDAVQLRLQVRSAWQSVPIHNVIARLQGTVAPDEWVIRGNHHDAWVYGAADPGSAVAALLEEARIVGELRQQGWSPGRTLVYALWDAEEHGMTGATEWVEQHQQALRAHAVAYVNSDLYSRGYIEVGGSTTLQAFVTQVADTVIDPQSGTSVRQRLDTYAASHASPFFNALSPDIRPAPGPGLPMVPLGGGSDFMPFLQHAGIATLQLGYFGEGLGGEFHSRYDTYENYLRFGDPGFEYGVTLVQTSGRMMLRLANASRLPLRFSGLARHLEMYVSDLLQVLPAGHETGTILKVLEHLGGSSLNVDTALDNLDQGALHLADSRELNRALRRFEQGMIRSEGLPDRPWYRHWVYAPGIDTGYDPVMLPALQAAISSQQAQNISAQLQDTAHWLEQLAVNLDNMNRLLMEAAQTKGKQKP